MDVGRPAACAQQHISTHGEGPGRHTRVEQLHTSTAYHHDRAHDCRERSAGHPRWRRSLRRSIHQRKDTGCYDEEGGGGALHCAALHCLARGKTPGMKCAGGHFGACCFIESSTPAEAAALERRF